MSHQFHQPENSPVPQEAGAIPPFRLIQGSDLDDPGNPNGIQGKVDYLASHMHRQLMEHEAAMTNTNSLFGELLNELATFENCFNESFSKRELAEFQVNHFIDSDRSVGILNILWQSISFTTRGNTKPLALSRLGRPPLFTGRIVALHGDFRTMEQDIFSPDFTSVLYHELASLYVPADPNAPAVLKVKHLGDEEQYIHQAEAARAFLLRTVEVTCGGGFFHEDLSY